MVIKINITTLLIILSGLLNMHFQCHKRLDCAENTYSFGMGIKAYPDLDSVKINDTIWLEFSSPMSFKDLNTGNIVDYSNANNLGTSIDFLKFSGGSVENPGVIAAANDFDYDLISGIFVFDSFLPEKNKDYRFIERDNEYKFKLGIIPKRTGVFAIGVSNAVNVYKRNDECTKASFLITLKNSDQHLYLYQQNRPGYNISQYEKTHMYCFKVK